MEVGRDTMNDKSNDEILTTKELSAYLKMAEKTIYRFASDGKIPGFKVGSNWRFSKPKIESWIKSQIKGKIQ